MQFKTVHMHQSLALVEAVDGEHLDNQALKPRSGARGGLRIEWKIINGNAVSLFTRTS
ncbi:MAG: hypothetical protein KA716_27870 [Gloeotrichia echinulata DEX184]|jgi:hypothetical protein|nr:hypothetical protein [Gloeotrichia echinulata DEX184]